MSRMQRAVLLGVLAAVGLWPLVHRALVARYDINPWKLAGFAMYSVPTPPVQVVLFEKAGKGLRPLDEQALPGAASIELQRFRRTRYALGDLARPDGVGRAVLAARPDLAWVVIATQRMQLDPATARMTSVRSQYTYHREP